MLNIDIRDLLFLRNTLNLDIIYITNRIFNLEINSQENYTNLKLNIYYYYA